MVRPERLELPAYWFEASRSIRLSYGRSKIKCAWLRSRLGHIRVAVCVATFALPGQSVYEQALSAAAGRSVLMQARPLQHQLPGRIHSITMFPPRPPRRRPLVAPVCDSGPAAQ